MLRFNMPLCRRQALGLVATLALTVAPYQIALHGSAPGIHAASAQAGNGNGNSGNGHGNGGSNGGGGNSGKGNDGGSGNGNSGNGGNGKGGSGKDGGSGNGKGNSGGKDAGNSANSSASVDNSSSSPSPSGNSTSNHLNAATGDKVQVDGGRITVQHPDGMTEQVENGRFRMEDALGRTIIDRRATPADMKRLKAL